MSAPVGVNRVKLTRPDPNKVAPDLLLYSNVIGRLRARSVGCEPRVPAAQGLDLPKHYPLPAASILRPANSAYFRSLSAPAKKRSSSLAAIPSFLIR